MAVRLSVILIQSRPPSAGAQRLAEEVVGELIGFRGIDLVLVEPLQGLELSSTDRLTLGSLSGDVAVLDWKSPEDLFSDLSSVEFEGERTRHAHDPTAESPTTGNRRIYLFDLTRFTSASQLIDALSQLQSTRQVRTFSLGPGLSGSAANGKSASRKSQEEHAKPTTGSDGEATPMHPASAPKRASSPPSASAPSSTVPRSTVDSPRDTGRDRVDLDSLIDELDQIDP